MFCSTRTVQEDHGAVHDNVRQTGRYMATYVRRADCVYVSYDLSVISVINTYVKIYTKLYIPRSRKLFRNKIIRLSSAETYAFFFSQTTSASLNILSNDDLKLPNSYFSVAHMSMVIGDIIVLSY
jgi:heme/copper-type cytochrome/quinol oxidase subunit 1